MQGSNVKKITLGILLILSTALQAAPMPKSVLPAGAYAVRGVVLVDQGKVSQGFSANYQLNAGLNSGEAILNFIDGKSSRLMHFELKKTAAAFCAILRRERLAKSCVVKPAKGMLFQHEAILEASSRHIAALKRQGVRANQVLGAPNTIIATAGDDLAADAAVILISKDGVLVSKPSGEYQVLGLSTGNRSRLFKQGL